MEGNGQSGNGEVGVLRWPGRVLSADDLRRHLNGQRELVVLPRAVITPLAADQLRANGVRIIRNEEQTAPKETTPSWGYALDRNEPVVTSAIHSLEREGLSLQPLTATGEVPGAWARSVAACVARGECQGGVVFCQDPGVVCCIANKIRGLRAVSLVSVAQAARAVLTLAPNLVVIETPGRTLFEIRQIVRTICGRGPAVCPPGVACTLQELDGHAHR